MDIPRTPAVRNAPEQKPTANGDLRPVAVKLVEMGDVSVETKGTIHGLEIGLIPRSF